METKDLLLLIFGAAACVLLFLLTRSSALTKHAKLRALFVVPMMAAFLHIDINAPELSLIGLYAGCILMAAMAFTEKWRNAVFAASLAAMASAAVICPLNSSYRSPGYAKNFEKCLRQMKDGYVLTDYKQIDWDGLHEKYLPLFREADQKRDEDLMYEAGRRFAMEFRDGHVNFYYAYSDELESDDHLKENYDRAHCGEDYGFSLLRRSDGKVVFVSTEPSGEAYSAGIRDGMVITSINGTDIEDIIADTYVWYDNFPDIGNEKFYAPITATSSLSGDISVEFVDDDNVSRSAVISPDGSFYDRYKETLRKIDGTPDMNNMSYYMVDDNTGCIVINGMVVDGHILASPEAYDNARQYLSEKEVEKLVRSEYGNVFLQMWYDICEVKKNGAENLILDLRGNGGGELNMIKAVGSLLTDERLFVFHEGERLPDGGYGIYDTAYIEPENKWGSGNIVILVNRSTASAGEIISRSLGKLDNVTVMGFTKTCGCAQSTKSCVSGEMCISSSFMLALDENGEILIDAGPDRVTGYAPDIIMPVDDDVIRRIFVENEDYLLNRANEYLDMKKGG